MTREDDLTSTLLVEQARALVEVEEGRFAALQSQATTLLAVIGVVASIGGTLLAGLHGRRYELLLNVCGFKVSLVLFIAIALGVFAIQALLSAATAAMGAMQQKPDPAAELLPTIVGEQFPDMLGKPSVESAQAIFALLTHQLRQLQYANLLVRAGLRAVASRLAVGVLSGLALALVLMLGTVSTVQDTHLLNTGARSALTVKVVR